MVFLVGVLGLLGFSSYKIVSIIRDKSINKNISSNFKSDERGDSDVLNDYGIDGENFSEFMEFSLDNLRDELGLGEDFLVKNSNEKFVKLKFTSVRDFLVSYNELVAKLDGDLELDSFYYTYLRCTMVVYNIDNVELIAFSDGSTHKVTIKGFEDSLEGVVDEEDFEITRIGGDTIITYIGSY